MRAAGGEDVVGRVRPNRGPVGAPAQRRRSRLWSLAAVAAAAVLTGCTIQDTGTSEGSAVQRPAAASSSAAPEPGSGRADGGKDAGGSAGGGAAPADLAATLEQRREVVTAELVVRTRDVAASRAAVRRAATAARGYLSDESTTDEGGRQRSELTVRVPVAALDRVMDEAARTGTALSRSRRSEDVTGTYVDTSSRVRSQRASVERVRALLARATTIGQVVQVESELARREADLEALEAQLQRLDQQTSLATLVVSLVPPPAAGPVRARDSAVACARAGTLSGRP
jgi:hypothetical protein